MSASFVNFITVISSPSLEKQQIDEEPTLEQLFNDTNIICIDGVLTHIIL